MSDEPSQGESSEVQFVEQSGDEENLWEHWQTMAAELGAEARLHARAREFMETEETVKAARKVLCWVYDAPVGVSNAKVIFRAFRCVHGCVLEKRKVVDEDDITHAPLDSNHQSAKPVKKRRRILPEAVPTEEEEEEDNDVITVPVRNPVKSNQPLREVHKTPPAKPQQNDRRSPPFVVQPFKRHNLPCMTRPQRATHLYHHNYHLQTNAHLPHRLQSRSPHLQLSPNAEARLARWEKDVNFHEPNTNDTVHLLNDDSYRNGVVPETQEPLLSPPPPDVSPVRLHTIMDIPSTPREKLIWRMRPKTPSLVSLLHGSPAKSSPSHPSRKPLRPVPVVTPSAFALNMPSTFDTIQTADIDEVDNDHADDSIDQFSSPLKGAQGRRSSKQRSAPTSNNKRTPSPRTPKQISGGSRANSQLGSGSRMFQFNASGLLGTSKSNDAEQIQGSDPRIQLREEEEENTQDLAAPLQDDDVQIPQPQASTISSPHPPPNDSPKVPRPPSPISPGLQNGTVIDDSTVSDLPQTESQESQDRTNSSQPSHTYPPTQGEHLGAALTLLNTKSEEISKIEAELSTERAKNAESNRQIDFLRGRLVGLEAMATETARERSRERHDAERMLQDAQRATRVAEDLEAVAKFNLDKVRAVEESKREELVVERDRWKSECDEVREERDRLVVEKASLLDALELSQKGQTEWETEKAAMEADIARLKAAVEAANESKRSTEKDCEFFRDQYAQASGFVTTVREENAELEKRVKIAESQTSTGVDAVRMLYERQVEAAQQDTARWKHLTDILTERDMRTGGEDIRRRANLEPELRKRVDELEATILRLQDDVDTCKAEAAVLKRDKDRWVHYNEVWKKTVSAQADEIAKRNKLVSSQLSIGDSIEPARLHSVEDSDELVYPCLWRFDTLQPPFSCTSLFADIEGLHHHVISVHAEDPSDPE
ncbi:hypothetical protein PTI98_012848 [Pleurotus ostreatus]|nr:hypothetical protein PTI98_012848 [Pleurotus ostreatus]